MPGTMFIQPSSLAALPTTGTAWNRLVAKSTADPGSGNLGLVDQLHPLAVFSIALRWARDGGGLGKQRVIDEIKAVMGTETSGVSGLAFYRTLGAYIMAADLVDMPGTTVGANNQTFNAWIQSLPHKTMPGQQNWGTLWKCADMSANNWGACARVSLLAATLWMQKQGINPVGQSISETGAIPSSTAAGMQAQVVARFKRWCGDLSVPNTFKASGSFNQSWAVNAFPGSQGGLNPVTSLVKSGVAMDGINCEDASRSTFPDLGGNGKHYSYEAAESALTMIVLLINAGYSDAASWGSNGVRRNYKSFMTNGQTTVDADYHSFFSMDWVVVNWFWNLGFPSRTITGDQRRMLTTHTDWLTSSNSTWVKIAGGGSGGGGGGGTEEPVETAPTAAFTLARSGQVVTLTDTSTAGNVPITKREINWGDGSAIQTLNAPTATATHTYNPQQSATFTVRETVSGTTLSGVATRTVTVPGIDGAPVAVLNVTTPLRGNGPLTVTVNFTGSFDPNGDAMTGTLDWGDGTVQTGLNVASTYTHIYAGTSSTATYTLSARVVAGALTSTAQTRTVTVEVAAAATPTGRLFIVFGGRLYLVNPDQIIPLPAGAPVPSSAIAGRDVIFRTS